MMSSFFSISQLAERCRAEAARYQQTGQSDEAYCLELFRLALREHNSEAWEAIYTQYQALAASWVYRYSRFPQTNEEADFFINEAFARMWRFASKPETAKKLSFSLSKCLRFLKMCVGSAIEEYLRQERRDVLLYAVGLEDYEEFFVSETDAPTNSALSAPALRRLLTETIQSEAERLVAEDSWGYDLAPRHIQLRHPDVFVTVESVSQVKKNLLKRLRRKLKKEFGDSRWPKNG
ncbi:MAG: hypothetical protein U0401_31185 [Anaerolineae bacterium]